MCYQRAIQLMPDYAIAYGNLASVYYEQGQMDLAIMHYKQAIMLDSSFVEAYNNLGSALKSASSSSVKSNVMPRRFYSSSESLPPRKVVVLGAAGGIG